MKRRFEDICIRSEFKPFERTDRLYKKNKQNYNMKRSIMKNIKGEIISQDNLDKISNIFAIIKEALKRIRIKLGKITSFKQTEQ